MPFVSKEVSFFIHENYAKHTFFGLTTHFEFNKIPVTCNMFKIKMFKIATIIIHFYIFFVYYERNNCIKYNGIKHS